MYSFAFIPYAQGLEPESLRNEEDDFLNDLDRLFLRLTKFVDLPRVEALLLAVSIMKHVELVFVIVFFKIANLVLTSSKSNFAVSGNASALFYL